MIDFSTAQSIFTPKGEVAVIARGAEILWRKQRYKTELLYLESTGTQYIDTGVLPKGKSTSVEFVFSLSQVPTSVIRIFGSRASSNQKDGTAYNLFTGTTEGSNRIRNDWSYNAATAPYRSSGFCLSDVITADTDILVQLFADSSSKIQDGVFSQSTVTKVDCAYSMYLGNINTAGSAGSFSDNTMRFKYCKIWESGTLVRDLIPVLDWNDVPCMYDKVSGKLFYNQGSGEFAYGELQRLPLEYQEVAYLESTGTQYIDTGVYGSAELMVEATVLATDQTTARFVFGARSAANQATYACLIHSSKRLGYRVGDGKFLYVTELDATDNKHIYKIDNGVLYRDGTFIHNGCKGVSVSPNCPIALLTINTNGTLDTSQTFKGYLYSCVMYDGEELIRDFIPCYRKSDSKPGMYDLVTETFFTNAGSDEFSYGGDV